MTEEKYTMIFTAPTQTEALIVRDLLEANGIRAVIPDENSPFSGIDITPYDPAGGAGCNVFVPEAKADEAKRIVDSAKHDRGASDRSGS